MIDPKIAQTDPKIKDRCHQEQHPFVEVTEKKDFPTVQTLRNEPIPPYPRRLITAIKKPST